MRKIYIAVSETTLNELAEVAESERRDPRQQAAYMLERAVAMAAQSKRQTQPIVNNEELAFA